jgi:hypothetical protein
VHGALLLVFGPDGRLFADNDDANPSQAEGLRQGAALQFGNGRVAVFGEAAMFTAQLSGPEARPLGMNAPIARQNPQFVLNLLHWLASSPAGGRARRRAGSEKN